MNSPVKHWRNQKKITELVGKTGKIVTFTIIRVPPAGYSDQAPYAVAVIDFGATDRVSCQIVDCELTDISIGMTVRLTVRRVKTPGIDDVIPYGIKARPIHSL